MDFVEINNEGDAFIVGLLDALTADLDLWNLKVRMDIKKVYTIDELAKLDFKELINKMNTEETVQRKFF